MQFGLMTFDPAVMHRLPDVSLSGRPVRPSVGFRNCVESPVKSPRRWASVGTVATWPTASARFLSF